MGYQTVETHLANTLDFYIRMQPHVSTAHNNLAKQVVTLVLVTRSPFQRGVCDHNVETQVAMIFGVV